MENFYYSEENFVFEADPSNAKTAFDELLQNMWNSKMDEGNIFWYKLNLSVQRSISDKFLLQFIPDRASTKRPSVAVYSVTEPFNAEKFNFNKVKEKEKLFVLAHQNLRDEGSQKNVVVVNVSPLAPCNVLLVPNPKECLPQVLTEASLKTAIEFSLLSASRYFRVCFNGLGAFASVNHLHFHAYLLERDMFLETAIVEELVHPCYQLLDYPARSFVFQIRKKKELSFIATSIFKIVKLLQTKNIPHNLFISRGLDFESAKIGVNKKDRNCIRIYLWARAPTWGAKELSAFNIATCELFGHMVIKNETDYHTLTEEKINLELHDVTNETFSSLLSEVEKLF